MMNTKLQATGLKTIRGALERLQRENLKGWQDIASRELVREIQKTAPKDTGKYAKQWRVRRRNDRTKFKTVIHISPGVKKLPGPFNYDNATYQNLFEWLEFTGTKPHIIRPRKARMLHWVDKKTGMHHFRFSVRHPGTSAQPHVRPAMRRVLPRTMQRAFKGLRERHVWLKR